MDDHHDHLDHLDHLQSDEAGGSAPRSARDLQLPLPDLGRPGPAPLLPRTATACVTDDAHTDAIRTCPLFSNPSPARLATANMLPRSSSSPSPSPGPTNHPASLGSNGPTASSRSLPLLSSLSSTAARRVPPINDATSPSTGTPHMPRLEKETEDPSTPVERSALDEQRAVHTPIALAQLFAAAGGSTSPLETRQPSYTLARSNQEYFQAASEMASLPHHLYTRGLISGRHSDIAVHAFSTRYDLHRLILDRAPFFCSALSEPWFESSAKEITLHPEDLDSNITQGAFEIALKRLYGHTDPTEDDKEAIGLFATACWLEMADLIDWSVGSLLRQLCPSNISQLIGLVTSNYYGNHGERILASARAMLCKDGWEMPLQYWDGISGEIVRELVGGDGFFVPGEWERWVLAKKLLDRRLRLKAIEVGLFSPDSKHRAKPPKSIAFMAVRFDTVYRQNFISGGRQISENHDPWVALYTCPEVSPLLVLLDEGIHYVHMTFEQLQFIRSQRDFLGLPVLPERVISNALWMGMELRQKVVNAKELDLELGLRQEAEEREDGEDHVTTTEQNSPGLADVDPSDYSPTKGKWVDVEAEEDEEEQTESGSWDGNGKPRKFWIPSVDQTMFLGGLPDHLQSSSNHNLQRPGSGQASRLSATIQPEDVQWASDCMAATDQPPSPREGPAPAPICYTHFPPFRFSAEFPNPRLLKEKKRVYSRTVWYAGSMWNVYIQKQRSSKGSHLGVYLHRAKERDEEDKHGIGRLARGSVDERIGHLEREMLMRSSERRARHREELQQTGPQQEGDDDTSGSGGDVDATLVAPSSSMRSAGLSNLLRGTSSGKNSQTPHATLLNLPGGAQGDDGDGDRALADATAKFRVSTLPPYVDCRPTIKTYFKIYSPSRGGRMLSVYESAPDQFNFSQSWGWKSSALGLDDGILGCEEAGRGKNARLRFMVVIGNT
ncbi:MAG: hypothetical protein M1819_001742 [Sarea resinae]|nr:MAG: hypothetical protein M1819_001742 [Sarea resinae]